MHGVSRGVVEFKTREGSIVPGGTELKSIEKFRRGTNIWRRWKKVPAGILRLESAFAKAPPEHLFSSSVFLFTECILKRTLAINKPKKTVKSESCASISWGNGKEKIKE